MLELGEVLDALHGPLRAEDALHIDAAEADGVDAAAMGLGPDVAHQVSGRRGMAVDVAIEARHPLHAGGLLGLAVMGGVELLLRKLRHQEPHPFQILGVEDALEYFLEILEGHHFSLRHVSQVRPGGQEHGRRELGREVLGQVEIEVEAFQALELLDLVLGKEHASGRMVRVGQRQVTLGKQTLFLDFFRRKLGQLLKGHALGKFGGRSHRDRFAAGHLAFIVHALGQVVTFLQQGFLPGHDAGLGGLVVGHHLGEAYLADQDRSDLVVAGLADIALGDFGYLAGWLRW